MTKPVVTPDSTCPQCGKHFDRASPVTHEQATPTPGDFSLCIQCGTVLVFNDDLTIRRAEPSEIETIEPVNRVQIGRAQRIIRECLGRMN